MFKAFCYPLPYILYSPKTNPYYPCPHMHGYFFFFTNAALSMPFGLQSTRKQTLRSWNFWKTLSSMKIFRKLYRKLLYTVWVWVFRLVPFVWHHLLSAMLVHATLSPKQQQVNDRHKQNYAVLTFLAGLYTCVWISGQLLSHNPQDERYEMAFSCLIYFILQCHVQM